METQGTVTGWIDDLHHPDPNVREDAAWRIWDHYTPKLLELARRRIGPRLRGRVDPDDVIQSVYRSFFRRRTPGAPRPQNRDELLSWLIRGTLNKVCNAASYHQAECRDLRHERSLADDRGDVPLPTWMLEHMGRGEPTPDEAAAFAEDLEGWFRLLPADLAQVARWKFEDYSNAEIAARLRRTVRAVEFSLQRIRRRLAPALDPDRFASCPDGPNCPDAGGGGEAGSDSTPPRGETTGSERASASA